MVFVLVKSYLAGEFVNVSIKSNGPSTDTVNTIFPIKLLTRQIDFISFLFFVNAHLSKITFCARFICPEIVFFLKEFVDSYNIR